MTFKDLNLKDQYSPESSELLGHFYIPTLGMATRYKRLAGFFSSTSLAAAAIGMKKFIRNGGKMQLVTSVVLSQQDKEAMENGLDPKEMSGDFLQELEGGLGEMEGEEGEEAQIEWNSMRLKQLLRLVKKL